MPAGERVVWVMVPSGEPTRATSLIVDLDIRNDGAARPVAVSAALDVSANAAYLAAAGHTDSAASR